MKRTYEHGRIEIWTENYLMNECARTPEDKERVIVQCERGNDGRYIVETEDKETKNIFKRYSEVLKCVREERDKYKNRCTGMFIVGCMIIILYTVLG